MKSLTCSAKLQNRFLIKKIRSGARKTPHKLNNGLAQFIICDKVARRVDKSMLQIVCVRGCQEALC